METLGSVAKNTSIQKNKIVLYLRQFYDLFLFRGKKKYNNLTGTVINV